MTYRNRMFFYAGITAMVGSVVLGAIWPRSAEAFLFLKGQEIQQTINEFRQQKRAQQPNNNYTPGRNPPGFSQGGGGGTPRPPAPSTGFGGGGGSWGGFSQ